jgi:hypothetical protein
MSKQIGLKEIMYIGIGGIVLPKYITQKSVS